MRQIRSRALPQALAEVPRTGGAEEAKGVMRATVDLMSITPLLGGGVASFEPDTVDLVRVPSIRGQLRWWWRALYGEEEGGVDNLFRREANLWGGLGVRDLQGDKDHAVRSRVRLTVEVLDPGRVLPAGHHERGDGRVKTLPRWAIGSKLAYALFPLQQDHAERTQFSGAGAMPTKLVRLDLRFRLRLTVVPDPCNRDQGEAAEQVLAALWAWVQLGGLGARTRRGFGALAPAGEFQLTWWPSDRERRWQSLFAGARANDLSAKLGEFFQLAALRAGRFASGRLLMGGTTVARPGEAHENVVDLLREFRQGVGFARDAGDRRPGASRWPEGHLLRALWQKKHGNTRFEHQPPAGTSAHGAPRAAFGLPIQVRFKDRGDQAADATLLPEEENAAGTARDASAARWASPVLLRPLAVAGGYRPGVFFLGGRRPASVRVVFDQDRSDPCHARIELAGGAKAPVSTYLVASGGDALRAFKAWLEKEQGLTEVPLPPVEGKSDG